MPVERTRRRAGVLFSFIDMLLVIVAILIVSIAPKKVTTDGVKPNAEYQVSIEWPAILDDDVDLIGSGPPDPNKPCMYTNTEQAALLLDHDSRGFMDDRLLVEGRLVYLPHKEIMTVRGIFPGRYDFAVHLYKSRPGDDHRKRDPHALGIVVHVEVIKINPKVTTIFRKDFTLDAEGAAENVWSMDIRSDGGFVEVEPPVEPITKRLYRQSAGAPTPYTPGAALAPNVP